jgi:hypothetical protein
MSRWTPRNGADRLPSAAGPRVRALVFAGWELQELEVSVTYLRDRPANVGLGKERYPLPPPIVHEIVMDRDALLDRADFRRHVE